MNEKAKTLDAVIGDCLDELLKIRFAEDSVNIAMNEFRSGLSRLDAFAMDNAAELLKRVDSPTFPPSDSTDPEHLGLVRYWLEDGKSLLVAGDIEFSILNALINIIDLPSIVSSPWKFLGTFLLSLAPRFVLVWRDEVAAQALYEICEHQLINDQQVNNDYRFITVETLSRRLKSKMPGTQDAKISEVLERLKERQIIRFEGTTENKRRCLLEENIKSAKPLF